MRHKQTLGFSFLIMGLISFLLSFNWNLTGASIGINLSPSFLYFGSIIFVIASMIIFASRQTLDAIMIPTGGYEENAKRTKRALQEYNGKGSELMVISGGNFYPIREGQVYQIYQQLRKYGIKPSGIMVEGKSDSTLDNVLYSLERLKKKGVEDIGIATSRSHFNRFDDIIEKAREEGIVDKNFRVHQLEVPESMKQRLYGAAARISYRYKLRKGLNHAQKHQNKSQGMLRRIRNRIFK